MARTRRRAAAACGRQLVWIERRQRAHRSGGSSRRGACTRGRWRAAHSHAQRPLARGARGADRAIRRRARPTIPAGTGRTFAIRRTPDARISNTAPASRPLRWQKGWRACAIARRPAPDPASLAGQYLSGAAIDWAAHHRGPGGTRRPVALPTYPFERQSYWALAEVTAPATCRGARGKPGRPLAGATAGGPRRCGSRSPGAASRRRARIGRACRRLDARSSNSGWIR